MIKVDSSLLLSLLLDHCVYIESYKSTHRGRFHCLINEQMRVVAGHQLVKEYWDRCKRVPKVARKMLEVVLEVVADLLFFETPPCNHKFVLLLVKRFPEALPA